MINISIYEQDECRVVKGRILRSFESLESDKQKQIKLKLGEKNRDSYYFLDFEREQALACFLVKPKKKLIDICKIKKPIFIPAGVKAKIKGKFILPKEPTIVYEGKCYSVNVKEI